MSLDLEKMHKEVSLSALSLYLRAAKIKQENHCTSIKYSNILGLGPKSHLVIR